MDSIDYYTPSTIPDERLQCMKCEYYGGKDNCSKKDKINRAIAYFHECKAFKENVTKKN